MAIVLGFASLSPLDPHRKTDPPPLRPLSGDAVTLTEKQTETAIAQRQLIILLDTRLSLKDILATIPLTNQPI